jgi:methionyl-tRNA formyltransferase
MRHVVHGQQAFGKSVLDALLERGEEIIAVYVAPEQEGQRADPLKEAALAHGLPIYQPDSYKDPAVWEQFSELRPDLCVMAFVTLFVPEEFLDIPTHGTIQYHPSLLPLHRGPSSINWPIIAGAKKTGLSIFWPDNGLDTGPILLQKEVEIGDNDTLGSIYFDKLFPLGVEAMLEAIDLVKADDAPRNLQDESQATYESWCSAEQVEIDWSKPAGETYNLIRGADPQPGAWTVCNGEKLQVYAARLLPAKQGGSPGDVSELTDDGIVVAAPGGQILVTRVRPAGGKKVAAPEFVAASGLRLSTRLG